jgi:hypothetical protein
MCARVVSGEGKETTRGGGGDVKSPPAPNGTGAALRCASSKWCAAGVHFSLILL